MNYEVATHIRHYRYKPETTKTDKNLQKSKWSNKKLFKLKSHSKKYKKVVKNKKRCLIT